MNTIDPTQPPISIVLPDGSVPFKRYAMVGRVNIHFTAFELKEGEDERAAVDAFNKLAEAQAPELAKMTQTRQYFWCEDDKTRELSRQSLLSQILNLFITLPPNGAPSVPLSEREVAGWLENALQTGAIKLGVNEVPPGRSSAVVGD